MSNADQRRLIDTVLTGTISTAIWSAYNPSTYAWLHICLVSRNVLRLGFGIYIFEADEEVNSISMAEQLRLISRDIGPLWFSTPWQAFVWAREWAKQNGFRISPVPSEWLTDFQFYVSKEDLADYHFNLGTAYLLDDMPQLAIGKLQEAVDLVPNAEAYQNLGIAQRLNGEFDQAIANFGKALSLGIPPGAEPTLHLNFGIALCELGRYDQGLGQLDLVVERPS